MIALGGIIVGLIAAAFVMRWIVIGAVHLLSKLERFYLTRRAIHERLNQPFGDGTDGDRFVTPRDFKVSHSPSNDTGAQRDHA